MADLGYVKALLRGIADAKSRDALDQIFTHVLGNIRVGVPAHQTRAVNLQSYFEKSTTAASTSEFSIAHGLNTAPHMAFVCLDLSEPGSRVGGLVVTKAADSRRVYLKADAGSTNAPITLLLE